MRTNNDINKSIIALDKVIFPLVQLVALIRNNESSSVFISFYSLDNETKYQIDIAIRYALVAYNNRELTNAQYLKCIKAIMRICKFYSDNKIL